jgi:hypothetical protein
MFEINKKYKIEDLNGTYYTATILEETETHIIFIDLHDLRQALPKTDIKRFKEVGA